MEKTRIRKALYIGFMGVFLAGCGHVEHQEETQTEAVSEEAVSEEVVSEEVELEESQIEEAARKESELEESGQEDSFYISEISDELFAQMYGKTYKQDCCLDRSYLRYVHVLHKNINGDTLEGELVCNVEIAQDLLEIFEQLYEAGYPIEKIRLMDEYDADDELAMEDNNSSCFNYRLISNSNQISNHGMGLAVDINTLYNPYVVPCDDGTVRVEPINAMPYVDRTQNFDYKIEENDLCYQLFLAHGFQWGGNYRTRKDYQHFELTKEKIQEITKRQVG